MSLSKCKSHALVEEIICSNDDCLNLFCYDCFKSHHPQHNFGVILNKQSQNSLVQWNHFLMGRIGQMRANIDIKGYAAFFQTKLNPNYPKGLAGQIVTNQIHQVITEKLDDCLNILKGNYTYISQCSTLGGLANPGILKDTFIFFLFDTNHNLAYLLQNFQKGLKQQFPHQQIYDYIYFTFNPKQLRQIQLKRKQLVKNVENQVLIKLKSPNVPYSPDAVRTKKIDQNLNISPRYIDDNKRFNSPRQTKFQQQDVYAKSPRSPKSPIVNRNIRTDSYLRAQNRQQTIKTQKNEETKQILKAQKYEEIKNIERAKEIKQKSQVKIQQQIVHNENRQQTITCKSQQRLQRLDEKLSEKQSTITITSAPEIEALKSELSKRQKSIIQLNKLINNEQQQLYYRQNQVEMLQSEIKKLLHLRPQNIQLKKQNEELTQSLLAKQKSIKSLNSLINNEEEELSYRQNQVQILSQEIKKMLATTKTAQLLQNQIKTKDNQILQMRNKLTQINVLLNVSSSNNSYDELKDKIRGIISQNRAKQVMLKEKEQMSVNLLQKIDRLNEQNCLLRGQVEKKYEQKTLDEQLLTQNIEMEAQIHGKDSDIKILIQLLKQISEHVPSSERQVFRTKLNSLKTLKLVSG